MPQQHGHRHCQPDQGRDHLGATISSEGENTNTNGTSTLARPNRNAVFYYIFEGEPVAENGFPQLDDKKPGLGLTLKTEFLEQFNIIE